MKLEKGGEDLKTPIEDQDRVHPQPNLTRMKVTQGNSIAHREESTPRRDIEGVPDRATEALGLKETDQ